MRFASLKTLKKYFNNQSNCEHSTNLWQYHNWTHCSYSMTKSEISTNELEQWRYHRMVRSASHSFLDAGWSWSHYRHWVQKRYIGSFLQRRILRIVQICYYFCWYFTWTIIFSLLVMDNQPEFKTDTNLSRNGSVPLADKACYPTTDLSFMQVDKYFFLSAWY